VAVLTLGAGLTSCSGNGSPDSTTTTQAAPSATPDTVPAPSGRLEAPALKLEEVVRLDKPTAMATRPGSLDVFIAEQVGTIRRISADPERGWARDDRAFLDISSRVRAQGERGLLSLVFSSDGRTLFTHYSDTEGDTVVDAWTVGANGVDTNSRRTIFTTPQPFGNHNGGQLAFGPDGFLYLGLGDGGGSSDPGGNAQNTSTVLGAILRIDPDGASAGSTYGIPADNPFRDGGAPEVWAHGLRNPWRFSFDRSTGDLWVADVGEANVEEVNVLPATNGRGAGRGANFGWPVFEGSLSRDERATITAVPPAFEYTHDAGACGVIGGYVYRGAAIPDLNGIYLYGDFCLPGIGGLRARGGVVVAEGPLGIEVPRLTAFGQDQNGELWALSLSGPVYRIVAA
jgi:glucose/arabinose dehydrogenase